MERYPVRVVGAGAVERGQHPVEPSAIRLGRFLRLDRGEMRDRLQRVQSQRAIKGRNRFLKMPMHREHIAQRHMQPIARRIERDRLSQQRLRLPGIAVQQQRIGLA